MHVTANMWKPEDYFVESALSFLLIWALRFELRFPGLGSKCFTCWAILIALCFCIHVVQDGVQVPLSEGDLQLLIFLANARITVMCTTLPIFSPFMLLVFDVLSIEGKSLHMYGKYSTIVFLVVGVWQGLITYIVQAGLELTGYPRLASNFGVPALVWDYRFNI